MALDQFTEMLRRMADIERRINNVVRHCRVKSVDVKKGTHRVVYALDPDGQEVESHDIQWQEQAGEIRTWTPPSVGQSMLLISPGGQIGINSFTIAGTYSDTYPQIHDKSGEHVQAIVPSKSQNPQPGQNNDKPPNTWTVKLRTRNGELTHTPGQVKEDSGTIYHKKNTGYPSPVQSQIAASDLGLSDGSETA